MSCSSTSVIWRPLSSAARVIRTSTLSLGWTKPATPDTSLMRTEAARMPSFSRAAIEALRPSPEILDPRIGSLTCIGVSTTRFSPLPNSSSEVR